MRSMPDCDCQSKLLMMKMSTLHATGEETEYEHDQIYEDYAGIVKVGYHNLTKQVSLERNSSS